MTCSLDARTTIERQVIVFMAGPIAERRALRSSDSGWRRYRSRDELTSFHEAGHAVAAMSSGAHVYGASVIPDPDVRVGNGHLAGLVQWGATSEPSGRTEPILTDREAVARLCSVLALQPGWKGALEQARALRARAVVVVETNWPAICALAADLQRKQTLGQGEIAAFVQHLKAA